jgi:hypothetical protein
MKKPPLRPYKFYEYQHIMEPGVDPVHHKKPKKKKRRDRGMDPTELLKLLQA